MIGLFFVVCLPLVLLIKRAKTSEKIDLNAAH
jgi:DHA2 family multidrug resistance protein